VYRVVLICALVLAALRPALAGGAEQYETYVQIDPSTTKGKLFVLVFTRKPGNRMSPDGHVVSGLGSYSDGDGGFVTFVLAPGETGSRSVTHEHQPGKLFSANVTVTREGKRVSVKYQAGVTQGAEKLYSSGGVVNVSADF
jgi:hypothetical protein